MSISYRTRKRIRQTLIILTIIAVSAIVLWLGWLVWLDRYVLYERGVGVRLDFTLSADFPSGTIARPPAPKDPITIVYQDEFASDSLFPAEKTSISGYYIDLSALKEDISIVREQLESLPSGAAVLLDVKNVKGSFYYSTTVGEKTVTSPSPKQMDDLIQYLSQSDLHVIARLPAFRDWYYGLHHVPQGLPIQNGGGSLWIDPGGCYWLNPTNDKALGYLIDIIRELKTLGFDEVVFTDFCFPDTDKIVFKGDKTQAITDAAATLVAACATDRFWVSFTGDTAFPLPQGSSRLYLENIAAADVQTVVEQIGVEDPAVHLLFYTASHDTRFNDYCFLRPLEFAE